MEIVRIVALVLHFVGLAVLLGGVLFQIKAIVADRAAMPPAMLHGALLQLVTGVVLTGVAEMTGEPDHLKIAVKTGVMIAVLALVVVFRGRDRVPRWPLITVGALTLVNIVVAVAWR